MWASWVACPMRLRKSMPNSNSSSVSFTSRAKSCIWRTKHVRHLAQPRIGGSTHGRQHDLGQRALVLDDGAGTGPDVSLHLLTSSSLYANDCVRFMRTIACRGASSSRQIGLLLGLECRSPRECPLAVVPAARFAVQAALGRCQDHARDRRWRQWAHVFRRCRCCGPNQGVSVNFLGIDAIVCMYWFEWTRRWRPLLERKSAACGLGQGDGRGQPSAALDFWLPVAGRRAVAFARHLASP